MAEEKSESFAFAAMDTAMFEASHRRGVVLGFCFLLCADMSVQNAHGSLVVMLKSL